MDLINVIAVAVALAMDACGVSLSLGIRKELEYNQKVKYILSFGFFQFLFSFLGAILGIFFENHIASVPSIIGGIAISIVGVVMVKEGMEEKSEDYLKNGAMYFILGISVSIDALVVGFTLFNKVSGIGIISLYTLIIGLISCILSGLSFCIAGKISNIDFISKYADYIGGAILIIFGIKMMFS